MNLAGVFNRNDLELIEKENKVGTKHVFHFEVPKEMTWKPIESGVFKFKGSKFKGGNSRIFNFASSAKENQIIVGTNISDQPSEFKAKLKEMEIGDVISMRGPFSFFSVDAESKRVALIAGGTGITPVRALLKDVEDNNKIKEITVFYTDSDQDFMFKDEIDAIVLKNPKIKVFYLKGRESLYSNLLDYVEEFKNDSNYFIAGSPAMIKAVKESIKVNGVDSKNIINQSYLNISKYFF